MEFIKVGKYKIKVRFFELIYYFSKKFGDKVFFNSIQNYR